MKIRFVVVYIKKNQCYCDTGTGYLPFSSQIHFLTYTNQKEKQSLLDSLDWIVKFGSLSNGSFH